MRKVSSWPFKVPFMLPAEAKEKILRIGPNDAKTPENGEPVYKDLQQTLKEKKIAEALESMKKDIAYVVATYADSMPLHNLYLTCLNQSQVVYYKGLFPSNSSVAYFQVRQCFNSACRSYIDGVELKRK